MTIRDVSRAQNLSPSADFSFKFQLKMWRIFFSVCGCTRILNLCPMCVAFFLNLVHMVDSMHKIPDT